MSYEPTLKDLQKKYEVAMKEKMCVSASGFSAPSTRRLLDGVPVAAAVASTALASTPSHAMVQNEDAHPPRAQAHAAREG